MGKRSNRELARRAASMHQQVDRRVIEMPKLGMQINSFSNKVRVEFTHNIRWLQFAPEQARQIAARLQSCADEADRKLVVVPNMDGIARQP